MPGATDLFSLTLHLKVLSFTNQHTQPQSWWGRAAHWWLLNLLNQSDPTLAQRMHDGDSDLRPFTVSSLLNYHPRRGLQPDQVYEMRVTALSGEIAAALQRGAAPDGIFNNGCKAELDRILFEVVQTRIESPGVNFHALCDAYLLPGHFVPRSIQLEFISPTAFKKDGRLSQFFPEPSLVFGSLLRRWNQFAPLNLPDELLRYARECLWVSDYSLRTVRIPLKLESEESKATLKGCLGWVRYRTNNFDRYWMSLVEALAAFSEFSGVGAKLSWGLGQTRYQRRA